MTFLLNLKIADIFFKITFFNLNIILKKKIIKFYKHFIKPSIKKNDSEAIVIDIQIHLFQNKKNLIKGRFVLPTSKDTKISWTHEARFNGWLNLKQKKAKFFCRRSTFYLKRILRFICASNIIWHNGCLLHASALKKNNQGYVFFGKQGVGKSTIVKLSQLPIIADDTTIIRRNKNNQIFVYSSPFDIKSKGVSSIKVKLKCLFILKQGNVNKILPILDNSILLLLNHIRPNLKFYRSCGILKKTLFNNLFYIYSEYERHLKQLEFTKDTRFLKIIENFN